MEAKIDFENLANENIVKIADRLGDLAEDSGDVFCGPAILSQSQNRSASVARKMQRNTES